MKRESRSRTTGTRLLRLQTDQIRMGFAMPYLLLVRENEGPSLARRAGWKGLEGTLIDARCATKLTAITAAICGVVTGRILSGVGVQIALGE